jgi:hypothetical protein
MRLPHLGYAIFQVFSVAFNVAFAPALFFCIRTRCVIGFIDALLRIGNHLRRSSVESLHIIITRC